MLQGLRPRKGFLTGRDRAPARSAGFKARYHESVSGGLRSVVAATAEELRFTDCLGRGFAGNAFGRQTERTLNHPSTTTPRRSCKQLPSRFHPVARWLLRRSVALQSQLVVHGNYSDGSGVLSPVGLDPLSLVSTNLAKSQRTSERRLRYRMVSGFT
jgi:hypothetical protein